MKSIMVAAALLILATASSLSQTDSSFLKTAEFSFSAGPTFPYLPFPFRDFWKSGIDVSAGYGYTLSSGPWGYGTIYGVLGYDRFPFDKDGFVHLAKIDPNASTDGDATVVVTIMAVAKGTFSSSSQAIAPYFTLGLGYMNVTSGEIRYKTIIARPKETRSGIAYQVGVGVDVPVTDRVKAFVDGRYFMGFTSDPGRQFFPINVGVRFTP